MANKHIKMFPNSKSPGKLNMKPNEIQLTHLLEHLYVKKLTIPSVGEVVESLEFSHLADVNINWYNLFGKLFAR